VTTAVSEVDYLMSCLAEAVGRAVALDADGQCTLAFEPDVEVTVAYAEPTDTLSLRSLLTPAGETPSSELLAQALVHNYGQLPPGYATALDPDSGSLVLLALIDAAGRSQQAFLQAMADMVDLAPELRARLADSSFTSR
jgi:hypothetical protein